MKTIDQIKVMEDSLLEARMEAREELLKSAKQVTNQLACLGFDYEIVEKNGHKKMGRPRKEALNGKTVG